MKSTNKIQAFTLSEIVVVLVLTSIVVGLAFMVLSLVQNRVHIIRENLNRNAEINKLKLSMTLDLNRFNIASFSLVDNELKLLSELDSVQYKFNPNEIIKDVDTFHVTLDEKSFYFTGKKIKNGSIDAIKLITSKKFKNQSLFIFKRNDANTYMKNGIQTR